MQFRFIICQYRNAFFPTDAKRAAELFAHGYKTARSHHELFLEKGFEPLERPDRRGLTKHKQQFEQLAVLVTKRSSLLRNSNSNPALSDANSFKRIRSPSVSSASKKFRENGGMTRNSRSFVGFSQASLLSPDEAKSQASLLSRDEDEDSSQRGLVEGSMLMARHLNT